MLYTFYFEVFFLVEIGVVANRKFRSSTHLSSSGSLFDWYGISVDYFVIFSLWRQLLFIPIESLSNSLIQLMIATCLTNTYNHYATWPKVTWCFFSNNEIKITGLEWVVPLNKDCASDKNRTYIPFFLQGNRTFTNSNLDPHIHINNYYNYS